MTSKFMASSNVGEYLLAMPGIDYEDLSPFRNTSALTLMTEQNSYPSALHNRTTACGTFTLPTDHGSCRLFALDPLSLPALERDSRVHKDQTALVQVGLVTWL